jgi:cytochrome P450
MTSPLVADVNTLIEHYRTMRAHHPVHFNPADQAWSVYRYEDVVRVLSDPATFSSAFVSSTEGHIFAGSLIATDPPRHRQLRALVTQAFTNRAVEALAPRIEAITTELLDAVMGRGEMDVIHDLAYPLPVIVIAEMLGIPTADRERFKVWSDTVVAYVSASDPHAGQVATFMEMAQYFMAMVEARRQAPGDDLLSALLAAQVDGESLTQMELIGFCGLLLVAGNETTTNLIGNAILCFTEHPEVWQRLRANPALLPQAIDEVLRYRSPVQTIFRTVKQPVTLGEVELPAPSGVLVKLGSANHDEAQCPHAEQFDIDRTPNRHIAFGYGIHYCLGAQLARLEAKIALGEMLRRFATIERVDDGPLEWLPSVVVHGVRRLPVRVTVAS